MKYRTWGKYQKQTVRQDREFKNMLVIRQRDEEVLINKAEIPSLIIALLEMGR